MIAANALFFGLVIAGILTNDPGLALVALFGFVVTIKGGFPFIDWKK